MEDRRMNTLELLDIVNAGETSRVQFKEAITSADSLAAEIVAMANSSGGMIIVGVKDKTGEITGLDYQKLQEYGNLAGNTATNNVLPLVYLETEAVTFEKEKKNVLIIHVKEGINKPYKDRNLNVWVKQGSDKRKITDNTELLRLYQAGGNLLADEMEVLNTSIENVDKDKVKSYLEKTVDNYENINLDFTQILNNINVIRNGKLTLGGLLFFGAEPQKFKPIFCIKAVSFFGNDIENTDYRSSRDIKGTIPELFEQGLEFLTANLKYTQQGQNVNSLGKLEISKVALEEVLQNALIHRDYLKNSPIRLLIFDKRVELISPGKLPNSLTVENIIFGNSVVRNNLLASYCVRTMLYRGLGSGVKRAIKEQPNIEFINDIEGEQFIVKIPRPQ